MKRGSKKSPAKHHDVTTAVVKAPHPEVTPSGYGREGAHLKSLAPIPAEAAAAPVEWAEKHAESLAPAAMKEMEWALKFGSDSSRYTAAKDLLAFKGLTTKPKEQAVIPQAMVFNFTGPVGASGAPVLPFMNAPVLDAGPTAVIVDAEAPAKKDTK